MTSKSPSEQAKNAIDVYRLAFRCLRLSQVLEVSGTWRRASTVRSRSPNGMVSTSRRVRRGLQIDVAEDAGSAAVDLADVYDLATLLAAQLGAIGNGGTEKRSTLARPKRPCRMCSAWRAYWRPSQ